MNGYNAKDFLMIRRLFQLSLKILPEFLVKFSCSTKSLAFLILLLSQTWSRREAGLARVEFRGSYLKQDYEV